MGKSLTDEPMKYCVKIPNPGTAGEVRKVLAQMIGGDIPITSLLMLEIFHHKVFKIYKDHDKVQSDEDVWIFQQVEEHKSLQLLNKDSSGKGIRTPILVSIPEEKLSSLPVNDLRSIIKDCVNPFLEGGWQDDDKDDDLYLIGIYNSSQQSGLIAPINYDHETVNLEHDITLGIQWTDKGENRLRNEDWPRHESAKQNREKEKIISLNDCFVEFTKKEILGESDAWYCSQCKKHQCAEKKFDLFSLPDTLIIHLKRFHYDRYFRNKICSMVDFPIEGLDMTEWISNKNDTKSCIYDLFAVSNHFGNLGGGHYTAYAKNINDKKWYNLDDSSVSELDSASRAKTESAYVLFYQRRQIKV